MELDNDNLRFKALQTSCYCPHYKPDNFIESFELDKFDCDEAKQKVRESIDLLSYSKNFRPIIIEILDILNGNKGDFLINKHKYMSQIDSKIKSSAPKNPTFELKINLPNLYVSTIFIAARIF